jgi:diaminopimelate decarboxylase
VLIFEMSYRAAMENTVDPAAPVPWSLLPLSADVDHDGGLTVGGVSVADVAAQFGTPVFIYDEAHLRARCEEAVAAFGPGVAFASKSFWCVAMAKIAGAAGMSIDVSTSGEMAVALAAGIEPERLRFHGNNKSVAELATALKVGVGRIVIDSTDEIARLETLAAATGVTPKVWIRVTPGVHAHTHAFVQTGQEDSKFGFSVASGAANAAVSEIRATGLLDLVGVHAHIGSQVFNLENFAQAASVVAAFFTPLGLGELCLGGGLGEAYVAGESAPSIAAWAASTLDALHAAGVAPDVEITAEPGRSIVARAGITVYTVGTIKDLPGLRTYVAVDGGMSDNPRPVLYGSGYETFLVRAPKADRPRSIRLVGKHCESGDVLVETGAVPADLHVGDLLATPVTGAYGYSMASNYNRVGRPPVVFVEGGHARLVLRRETDQDLLALEV